MEEKKFLLMKVNSTFAHRTECVGVFETFEDAAKSKDLLATMSKDKSTLENYQECYISEGEFFILEGPTSSYEQIEHDFSYTIYNIKYDIFKGVCETTVTNNNILTDKDIAKIDCDLVLNMTKNTVSATFVAKESYGDLRETFEKAVQKQFYTYLVDLVKLTVKQGKTI